MVSFEWWEYKVMFQHSSIAFMRWSISCISLEAYFSSGCSAIATLLVCQNHPNLALLTPVSDWKSIITFRQTSRTPRRRTEGSGPTGSSEIIEAERASMLASSHEHTSALRITDSSVRRIFHDDFHLHVYKIAIAQELSVVHVCESVNKQNMRY